MIARVGGDEFMLFIEELQAHTDATIMAERVLVALDDPIDLNGRSVYIAASIGIAFDWPGARTGNMLLREADLALYRAKAAGRGRYAVFETHMESGALERLDIEMGLRQALERGESSGSTTSRSSRCAAGMSPRSRRWCAGPTPRAESFPSTEFVPIARKPG